MKAAERSAIVVIDQNGSTWLALGGPIAEAWANGVATLGDIPVTHTLVTLMHTPGFENELSLSNPRSTQVGYERLFKAVAPNHAVFFGSGPPSDLQNIKVTVVTASEALLPRLTMLGAYICNGPKPRHTFPDPVVANGQNCAMCPSSLGSTVSLVTV
jgi:hypothetical protein